MPTLLSIKAEFIKSGFKANYTNVPVGLNAPPLGESIEKSPYYEDMAKVAFFLGGESKKTLQGLANLEDALQAELKRRNPDDPGNASQKKILDLVLIDCERNAGFTVGAETLLLVANVKPPLFQQKLRERKQWKDPGAGVSHGEFSHRIQWYLVVNQKVVSEPATVYAHIGCYDHLTGSAKVVLWDAICDRGIQFQTEGEDDFREPDKLNQTIKNSRANYPVLSALLTRRSEKRDAETQAFKQFGQANKALLTKPTSLNASHAYIANKLYKRDWLQLSDPEKQQVRDIYDAQMMRG